MDRDRYRKIVVPGAVGVVPHTNLKSISLDGADEDFRLAAQPVSNLFPAQWTISFWCHPGGVADMPTFGIIDATNANKHVAVGSYDGGLNIGDGTNFQLLTVLPNATANQWNHYVIVDDGTNYKRYKNGSQTHSDGITVNPASSTDRVWRMGASGFVAGFADWFNGNYDEWTMWNTALNPTEVSDLNNFGLDYDLSKHPKYANIIRWWRCGDKGIWDGSNWTFPDQIDSDDAVTSNCEEADVIDNSTL